jgi:hypothetical protein
MELASMLAGERFSDRPASVCPVIGAILRAYNDGLDDQRRNDVYRYAAEAVGTRGDFSLARRRAEASLRLPQTKGLMCRALLIGLVALFAVTASASAATVGASSYSVSQVGPGHYQITYTPYVVTGSRDPNVWPFTSNSIWNMPIGSGAQYVKFHATKDAHGGEVATSGITTGVSGTGAGMALDGNQMPLGWGYGVNLGGDINYIIKTSSTDPLRTVYQQQAWGPGRCNGTTLAQPYSGGPTPWKIRIPDSLVIADATNGTPNAVSAVVQPDGSIFSFSVTARCVAGADDFHGTPSWQFTPGVTTQQLAADENIYSTGIYGGHGGSGMSSYGGVLTAGDMAGTAPIHHALSMDINGAEYLYRNPNTGVGFVWPAATQDAASWQPNYYGGYHGHYPALRMGSLLAIPPDVTAASLGLTDPVAVKLFHAMQDYGVYIVDDTGWSSVDVNATPEAAGYVYAGLPGSPWGGTQPKYNQLGSVYGKLAVVGNNGPSSIGGGGTPRVPLAPPLAAKP